MDYARETNIENATNMIKRLSIYYYNIGLTYARNNEISRAISKLNQAIELSNENIEALNLLGLCYYRIGEFEKAKYFWGKSILVDNDKDIIVENPARLYISKVNQEIAETSQLIAKIKPLIEKKKYRKSVRILLKLIKQNASKTSNSSKTNKEISNVKLLNYLGVLCILSRKTKQAHGFWKKSLLLDKTNKQTLDYFNS